MHTATEVENYMSDYFEANEDLPWNADERGPDSWDEVGWGNGPWQVPGLGLVRLVEQYGGEGKGDELWLVIEVMETGQMFRKEGWYASYSGGEYDGDLVEVAPRLVERVEYQAV